MGIAVKEILSHEYFKEFYIVAGSKGLEKEIQGITVMDAPDCFHWTRGKELVLTTGYAISKEPDCIVRAFKEGGIKGTAAVMIKRERYLDEIPREMIDLFEEHDIPLITMPFSVPYMDVMNEITRIVINRTIRRFRISSGDSIQMSNLSYREQKIKRILQAVETEMGFPAYLYDLEHEKSHYSSANFLNIAEKYNLKESDFWNPEVPHTKGTLCDNIHMYRYRLMEYRNENEPPVSWVLIPIETNGITQAYFAVLEARELLDYYDEYSIRIAYLILQSVYEQIMVARKMSSIGFENYILFAIQNKDEESSKMAYHAGVQGVNVTDPYLYIRFRQNNPDLYARSFRKEWQDIFRLSCGRSNKLVFLDENEGMIFLQGISDKLEIKEREVRLKLEQFQAKISEAYPEMSLTFGLCMEKLPLLSLIKGMKKCEKALDMGKIVFPDHNIWIYEKLGPLAWLDIPKEELDEMLGEYRELMKEEKNIELLRTLKVYLESNLNYSTTAEKLYVHINTIRKRIDRIHSLLDIDWEEPVSCLKTQILLQYLEL